MELWWELFRWCWKNGMVPSQLRCNTIIPVPKKRYKGACVMDNFRGISLLSTVYKAMCMIVQDRLTQVVEERQLLAEEQGSFRKGRGCRDQMLALILLGQYSMRTKKGNVCGFF